MDAIKALESAWIRDRALTREILDDVVRSVYGYALRLASARVISVPSEGSAKNVCVDISAQTAVLRAELEKLLASLSDGGVSYPSDPKALGGVGVLASGGTWHRPSLVAAYPKAAKLLRAALANIYRHHPNIGEMDLEHEFRRKALVLALGGGGATGYVHFCLFRWLESAGISPELITGTSFGALAGYARCLQTRYDAAMTMLKLPGYWKIISNIRPCLDAGHHGLMGLCRIGFDEICEAFSAAAGYSRPPAFGELKIPFAAVATGIAANPDLAREIEPIKALRPISGILRMTHLSWRKALRHAQQIAGLIVRQKSGAVPVVLGFDSATRDMRAIDGVSFSALVPGVINAEIPAACIRSRAIADALFQSRGLYRLCDGGLASNVPVRAAFDEVARGRIRTRNAWILGIDVFAPQARDGLFYPLQQIANDNVCADARFADTVVRLKDLLNPAELSPTLSRMHWLNEKFRKAFDDETKVIQYAVAPLLPLGALDLSGFE